MARALEPSRPDRGKRSGAMLGRSHITIPNRKKPDALPVLIQAAL
jgi:hypothetical protein